MSRNRGRCRRRSSRRAIVAVVALGLGTVRALAQAPCESPAVKTYVSDFSGTRAGPPPAWKTCLDSLSLDPLGMPKTAVLQSFAALRARKGEGREPIEAERRLLQGSSRVAINRQLLDGWGVNLGVRRAEQKYDNVFYQALVGALSWIVLDRSSGLEDACVAPVVRLRGALRGGPNWREAESALLGFGDVSLWKSAGPDEVTLTGVKAHISGLSKADLEGACQDVRKIAMSAEYWRTVQSRLKNVNAQIAVAVPSACRLAACQAAGAWKQSRNRESWLGVQKTFAEDVTDVGQRLSTLKAALPEGINWTRVDDRLGSARGRSQRFGQAREPNGREMAPDVTAGLMDLLGLATTVAELRDVLTSKQVLSSLLAGDLLHAKEALGTRKSWRGAAAPLIAAYVTTSYWERGKPGRQAACREDGIDCSGGAVARQLTRVAGVLGLRQEDLKP